MNSNINLYKIIFYTTCSANKHTYTHGRYKKQILLYNKKQYNTYINTHTLL